MKKQLTEAQRKLQKLAGIITEDAPVTIKKVTSNKDESTPFDAGKAVTKMLKESLTNPKLVTRKVALKEVDDQSPAYALVIDEDGQFMQEDLMEYNQESELTAEEGITAKLDTKRAYQYAEETEATSQTRALTKWRHAVATLGANYDF